MTDIVRERQIRESLSRLTGGPWQTRHHPRMLREDVPYVEIVGEIEGASYITVAQIQDVEGDDVAARDAEFIAAARQDIPFLLAEIDRLRAVVEAASAWAKDFGAVPDEAYYSRAEIGLYRAVEAYEKGRAEAVEQ